MTTEEFLKNVCPNHTYNSKWNKSELLHILELHTHRTSPNTYIGDDMKNCKLGLYEVFWKSGGSSIASIGNMHNGVRWVAPTNWTSESDPTGRLDDKMIDSIERIVLLYGG